MEKMERTRNCPKCNTELVYSNKYGMRAAEKKGSVCNKCSQQGENHPWYGKTIPDSMRKSISNTLKGRTIEDEWITKFKKTVNDRGSFRGENNPFYGKKHSIEAKKKMRLSHIERISNRNANVYPNYNPNSIPILEQTASELGITDLQHAENGGEFYITELGYWVDGYSEEKNIVLEYDEPHHFNSDGTLKQRDIERQQEIEEYLNCKFIRISQ